MRRLERSFRSMATEYLALSEPITAADIERLIFVEIAAYVAEATAEVYDLYVRKHGVAPVAKAVRDASRALALTSLPAHMAGTGQAMLRVTEKADVAALPASAKEPAKRPREEVESFYCKRCNGVFTDPEHRNSAAHKAKSL